MTLPSVHLQHLITQVKKMEVNGTKWPMTLSNFGKQLEMHIDSNRSCQWRRCWGQCHMFVSKNCAGQANMLRKLGSKVLLVFKVQQGVVGAHEKDVIEENLFCGQEIVDALPFAFQQAITEETTANDLILNFIWHQLSNCSQHVFLKLFCQQSCFVGCHILSAQFCS